MANKVTGKINCKECKKEINWYYIYPNRIDSNSFEVHKFEKGKTGATLISSRKDSKPHQFGLNCPEFDCGVYNTFSYPEEGLETEGARE
ncbi:hypothetical protein [Bacillus wiedmannii]|uniref:hypothetical protein n=1 Tax=Bacillus wiedmannii TaxID=1890302 RepID=UPI000BEF9926|nr:hypothetical protein [Bacillus wiedmannii]PEM30904.1 hypothetical protein CN598_12295 [Bacillus wiedmannii]